MIVAQSSIDHLIFHIFYCLGYRLSRSCDLIGAPTAPSATNMMMMMIMSLSVTLLVGAAGV